MTHEDATQLAARVIRDQCEAAGTKALRIVLFGSRARQTPAPESDWDFLVCVDKDLSFPERARVASAIRTQLAAEHVSADIIIKSNARVEKDRDNVGVITHYALKEGISV